MVAASTSRLAPSSISSIDLVDRRIEELMFAGDVVTYGPVLGVTLAPSKRLRAMLALISARAAGVPTRLAVELAATIEIVHTFSLVHDDIEDGADTRRGHPAVHVRDGLPIAVNAGDALHALAWTTILALDARGTLDVARLFAMTLERMVVGQASDLIWTRDQRRDISYLEYVEMVRGKTGALIGFAAAAPSVLAGRDAMHLYQFGEALGVAFQLLDDVAGVRGDAHVLGKPVANGAASGPSVLATGQSDGVARAIEHAHQQVDAAREHLDAASNASELRRFADAMVDRLLEATRW